MNFTKQSFAIFLFEKFIHTFIKLERKNLYTITYFNYCNCMFIMLINNIIKFFFFLIFTTKN